MKWLVILLMAVFFIWWQGGSVKEDFQLPENPILIESHLTPENYFLGDVLNLEIKILYNPKLIRIDKDFLRKFQVQDVYFRDPPKLKEKKIQEGWRELRIVWQIQILNLVPGGVQEIVSPVQYWQEETLMKERVVTHIFVSPLIPPGIQVLERTPIETDKRLPFFLGVAGFGILASVWLGKIKKIFFRRSGAKTEPIFSAEISKLEELEKSISSRENPKENLQKLYWFLRSLKLNTSLIEAADSLPNNLLTPVSRLAFRKEEAEEREVLAVLENLRQLVQVLKKGGGA